MKRLTITQIQKRLARECEDLTTESIARSIGVSPEFISMVVHGHRKPSRKVLDYLGVRRVVSVQFFASR